MRKFLALMIVVLLAVGVFNYIAIAEDQEDYSREAVEEFCDIWNDYYDRNMISLHSGFSFKADNSTLDDICITYTNGNQQSYGISSIPMNAELFFIWKPIDNTYGFCVFSNGMKKDLEKVVIYTDDKIIDNIVASSGHADEDMWAFVLPVDDVISLYSLDGFTLQMTVDGKDERVDISYDHQDYIYDMVTFLVSAQLYSDKTYDNFRSPKYLPDDYQSGLISTSSPPSLSTQEDSASEVIEQKEFELGEIVEFGHYEQDNNRNSLEPIEWIVIGKSDNSLNLLSKKILDLQRYNIDKVDVTWTTCNLRKWLNDVFLYSAFSDDEKSILIPYDYEDTDGTKLHDYVYCLSSNEVEDIWPNQSDRVALVTDYVFSMEDYTNMQREGQWWLRSDSEFNGFFRSADDVYSSGVIGVDNFRSMTVGIRPCICVSKSAFQNKELSSSAPLGDKKNSVYIQELGVTVTLPDDYLVLYRDMNDDDPVLQQLGLSADTLNNQLFSVNSYLDVLSSDYSKEISVYIDRVQLENINFARILLISVCFRL